MSDMGYSLITHALAIIASSPVHTSALLNTQFCSIVHNNKPLQIRCETGMISERVALHVASVC